jgi:hypothetical protein
MHTDGRPSSVAGSTVRPASTRIAVVCGLVTIAAGIAFVMSRSPPALARSNAVPILGPLASVSSPYEACQGHEVLPSGTTSIRLSLEAMYGPAVHVRVWRDGRLLTSGRRASGWSRQSVTVPLEPLAASFAGVSVCFAIAPVDETVEVKGSPDAGGSPRGGAIRMEDLRPGRRSWWSLASAVARRMSLGRATGGVWVVVVAAAAMLALAAIVSLLLARAPP